LRQLKLHLREHEEKNKNEGENSQLLEPPIILSKENMSKYC
jgi:hypothetical protein